MNRNPIRRIAATATKEIKNCEVLQLADVALDCEASELKFIARL